jgi:hypothetical protein
MLICRVSPRARERARTSRRDVPTSDGPPGDPIIRRVDGPSSARFQAREFMPVILLGDGTPKSHCGVE